MYTHELKIPKERVAVIIGKEGETKKELESDTSSKIDIDSHEGDVRVSCEDPVNLLTAKEVVKAIGRGFNPDIAKLIIKQDTAFELLNILDYVKTKKDIIRLKGRIIGAEGKSRKTIEDLTDVHISVYGKTVGIIGETQRVTVARRAIESLLSGSPHSKVYHWLEKQRRELKKMELLDSSLIKEDKDATDTGE
ncbi:MAG: KH domain-containing protein [Candidatus Woesearchaeota archaeon]